jgi:hypothetical protein
VYDRELGLPPKIRRSVQEPPLMSFLKPISKAEQYFHTFASFNYNVFWRLAFSERLTVAQTLPSSMDAQ